MSCNIMKTTFVISNMSKLSMTVLSNVNLGYSWILKNRKMCLNHYFNNHIKHISIELK